MRNQIAGLTEDISAIISRGPELARTAVDVINRTGPYIDTLRKVVEDPAFPTVMQRIDTIASLAPSAPSAATPTAPTPYVRGTGVGLAKAVPILDAYIYAQRNPWAPWVVVGGVIALIGGIGYRIGKRKG